MDKETLYNIDTDDRADIIIKLKEKVKKLRKSLKMVSENYCYDTNALKQIISKQNWLIGKIARKDIINCFNLDNVIKGLIDSYERKFRHFKDLYYSLCQIEELSADDQRIEENVLLLKKIYQEAKEARKNNNIGDSLVNMKINAESILTRKNDTFYEKVVNASPIQDKISTFTNKSQNLHLLNSVIDIGGQSQEMYSYANSNEQVLSDIIEVESANYEDLRKDIQTALNELSDEMRWNTIERNRKGTHFLSNNNSLLWEDIQQRWKSVFTSNSNRLSKDNQRLFLNDLKTQYICWFEEFLHSDAFFFKTSDFTLLKHYFKQLNMIMAICCYFNHEASTDSLIIKEDFTDFLETNYSTVSKVEYFNGEFKDKQLYKLTGVLILFYINIKETVS